MNLDSSIEKTLAEIQNVMSANSIVGNPIKTNDKTIIPISKAALGFGVGVANNNGNSDTNLGGAGGGGSIDPVAFVIIYENIPGPEGVEILPVEGIASPYEEVLSSVGNILSNVISNANVQPANTDKSSKSNIDKIKTKIKNTKDD